MNMIERVARAMYTEETGDMLKYDRQTLSTKDLRLRMAKAAIEAMKEPTDEMMATGIKYSDVAIYGYVAMIEAALKEGINAKSC